MSVNPWGVVNPVLETLLSPFQKPPSTNSAPVSWQSCRHTSSLLGPNQPIASSPEVTCSQSVDQDQSAVMKRVPV